MSEEGKVYEIAGLDEITRSTTFPLDMEIGGNTLETCKGKNGEREQKLSELGFAIENDNPYHSKTLDDGRELRFYGDIIFFSRSRLCLIKKLIQTVYRK